MKKKSQRGEPASSAAEKTRKHGPDKEKVQITVRLDKDLMDQASAVMESTNTRLTDLLERGLILAIREEDQNMPLLTSQVRFLVANTTRTEQEDLRDYMTFLRMDEIRKPTDVEIAIRGFIRQYLKTFLQYRNQAMQLYSRYGRTAAEVEKLTG